MWNLWQPVSWTKDCNVDMLKLWRDHFHRLQGSTSLLYSPNSHTQFQHWTFLELIITGALVQNTRTHCTHQYLESKTFDSQYLRPVAADSLRMGSSVSQLAWLRNTLKEYLAATLRWSYHFRTRKVTIACNSAILNIEDQLAHKIIMWYRYVKVGERLLSQIPGSQTFPWSSF